MIALSATSGNFATDNLTTDIQMIEIQALTSFDETCYSQLENLMAQLTQNSRLTPEKLSDVLEHAHLFMAKDGDKIVGCATLCPFFSPTGRKASIEDVVVSAEYRGKGIGRKLVEAAIEKAKASAPITLQLTSRPTRVAANRLYQSMGFTPKETNFYFLKLQ